MTSIPLARVFQCLFTFALLSALRWLSEIWQLSRRGATGNWRRNSYSSDVVASSPSFSRPTTRAPRRAFSPAINIVQSTFSKTDSFATWHHVPVLERRVCLTEIQLQLSLSTTDTLGQKKVAVVERFKQESIGSLSTRVFETRTATGREDFAC